MRGLRLTAMNDPWTLGGSVVIGSLSEVLALLLGLRKPPPRVAASREQIDCDPCINSSCAPSVNREALLASCE